MSRGWWNAAITDIQSNDIDGIITKTRTMLEEVCIQILEKRGELNEDYRGKLGDLFTDVRNCLGMDGTKVPKDVKEIEKSLNKIVSSISALRNNHGDCHGRGSIRVSLSKSETTLAINAAITIAEYILSIDEETPMEQRTTKSE